MKKVIKFKITIRVGAVLVGTVWVAEIKHKKMDKIRAAAAIAQHARVAWYQPLQTPTRCNSWHCLTNQPVDRVQVDQMPYSVGRSTDHKGRAAAHPWSTATAKVTRPNARKRV